jgi:Tfp pilus assembly major pilin PilA
MKRTLKQKQVIRRVERILAAFKFMREEVKRCKYHNPEKDMTAGIVKQICDLLVKMDKVVNRQNVKAVFMTLNNQSKGDLIKLRIF